MMERLEPKYWKKGERLQDLACFVAAVKYFHSGIQGLALYDSCVDRKGSGNSVSHW